MDFLDDLVLGLHHQEPADDSDGNSRCHPDTDVAGNTHEALLHFRISIHKLAEGTLCQEESDQSEQQHRDGVGQTVGYH